MSHAPIEVDVAAIGTGQATPALATALAARGESVVVFERRLVGGSCVNVGCTPTKTLRKTAQVAHLARRGAEFGVHVGTVTVDVPAAMARVQAIVEASRSGLERWLGGTDNLQLVRADARFNGRHDERFVIEAGSKRYHASRVYLNVGTRPALPPIPGLAGATPLTNESIMALRVAPTHLIIIGGSYIGLEFAQIFRRLGSDVTVIEASGAIASRETPDISARLTEMLESEGIRILAGAAIESVTRDAQGGVRVIVAGHPVAIDGTELLAATGRTPNTDGMGLETVGVTLDAQGYIPVDGTLATAVPGIWALGDVNRRGAFTHTAWQDHEIVLANRTADNRTADGRITTYAMYTDPPLGRIGMHEGEARVAMRTGRRFLFAQHEMSNVSRAREEGETIGVIKVLVDADTDRFAGITMLGIHADEIVQVIGAMMAADAPYQALRDFLPVHPTVTEFFPTILGKLAPLE
ncbi:MAG: mercuric reductase [Gemmatimonadaceae bacterium]|nr:mercuric reductase [Gemmatimonadaceae bacterium]